MNKKMNGGLPYPPFMYASLIDVAVPYGIVPDSLRLTQDFSLLVALSYR